MKPMALEDLERTNRVLVDVRIERTRQHAKWGEQNHPDGTGLDALFVMASYGCDAEDAKACCQAAFRAGEGTYAHILWEEFAEALEETDPKRLRAELVQVAAVVVQWIEKLDRERLERALLKADQRPPWTGGEGPQR